MSKNPVALTIERADASHVGSSYTPPLFLLPTDCISSGSTALKEMRLSNVIISNWTTLKASSLSIFSLFDSTVPSAPMNWTTFFQQHSDLKYLEIVHCGLTGLLPNTLPTFLSFFSVQSNHLTGSIPSGIFSELDPTESTIIWFDVSHNALTSLSAAFVRGPPFQNLGMVFDASFNAISGAIPSSIITSLISVLESARPSPSPLLFDVSHNEITGPSSDFGFLLANGYATPSTISYDINLSHNMLKMPLSGGLIPEGTCSNLIAGSSCRLKLDLSSNAIDGPIFPFLIPTGTCSSTIGISARDPILCSISLILANNSMSGMVTKPVVGAVASISGASASTDEAKLIILIDLSHNNIISFDSFLIAPGSASVTNSVGWKNFETSITVNLSSNAIAGNVSNTLTYGICNASNITSDPLNWVCGVNIDLSKNLLSGSLPSTIIPTNGACTMTLYNNILNHSICNTAIDLSSNRITGNLPRILYHPDACLDRNNSQCNFDLNLSDNSISGSLSSDALLTVPGEFKLNLKRNLLSSWSSAAGYDRNPTPKLSNYLDLAENSIRSTPSTVTLDKIYFLNISGNPLRSDRFIVNFPVIGGGIYDFSYCELTGTLNASRAKGCPSIFIVSNNDLSGTLLPASPCYSLSPPYGNSIMLLDISNNPRVSGKTPNFWSSHENFPQQVKASNTSLSGIFGYLQMPFPPQSLFRASNSTDFVLDLALTEIDFCTPTSHGPRIPWNVSLEDDVTMVCNLNDTTACFCPHLYPLCSPSCTPEWLASHPNCTNGVCIIPGSVNSTELVITPGTSSTTITGNLTSPSVVLPGFGSTLIVYGCAYGLHNVTIKLSTADIELLKKGKLIQTLLTTSQSSTGSNPCPSIKDVPVIVKLPKDGACQQIKVSKIPNSPDHALSVLLALDESKCRSKVWWIVLVSVFGAVLLVAAIAAIVIGIQWSKKFNSKAREP